MMLAFWLICSALAAIGLMLIGDWGFLMRLSRGRRDRDRERRMARLRRWRRNQVYVGADCVSRISDHGEDEPI